MMSPRDLVKRTGFGGRAEVCVTGARNIFGGGAGHKGCSCQFAVVQALVKDAGLCSCSCGVVAVHLAVGPLGVAQEFGVQRGVQGKEGLDQGRLRL